LEGAPCGYGPTREAATHERRRAGPATQQAPSAPASTRGESNDNREREGKQRRAGGAIDNQTDRNRLLGGRAGGGSARRRHHAPVRPLVATGTPPLQSISRNTRVGERGQRGQAAGQRQRLGARVRPALHALENRSQPLPAADAHRLQAIAPLAAVQLAQKRR